VGVFCVSLVNKTLQRVGNREFILEVTAHRVVAVLRVRPDDEILVCPAGQSSAPFGAVRHRKESSSSTMLFILAKPDVMFAGARKLSDRVAMFRIPSRQRPAMVDEDGEKRYCEVTSVVNQSVKRGNGVFLHAGLRLKFNSVICDCTFLRCSISVACNGIPDWGKSNMSLAPMTALGYQSMTEGEDWSSFSRNFIV
jgi:hypothetical protein